MPKYRPVTVSELHQRIQDAIKHNHQNKFLYYTLNKFTLHKNIVIAQLGPARLAQLDQTLAHLPSKAPIFVKTLQGVEPLTRYALDTFVPPPETEPFSNATLYALGIILAIVGAIIMLSVNSYLLYLSDAPIHEVLEAEDALGTKLVGMATFLIGMTVLTTPDFRSNNYLAGFTKMFVAGVFTTYAML